MAVEEDADAVALAEKKAAKKAKKAAAAAAAEEPEEDAEAVALAAKKAAKKAKKAAAAAAEPAAEEEDAEATALAAKKAAKAAKKAAAEAPEKTEVAAAPKKEEAPAKVEAAAAPAEEEWKDITYQCCDCSADWIDTIGDQEFRYDKGFAETPKRCKDCRWAKKVRMEGGDPEAKGKSKGAKGKDGGDKDVNTVFVRGLPFAATEESLNKDFGECGEIVTLRMPLNDEGTCKGFCFIKYTDKESMDKAMKFNETDYGGRMIYCSDAAVKPEGKGKGKDGKDGKGKGKDGKGKKGKDKGKKGKASSESFSKATGAMVESTGTKVAFADSDDE